jgi:lipopolysaccharide biosynthesis regulator YciM
VALLVGVVVIAASAGALYFVFKTPRRRPAPDHYAKALELWLAGDLEAAAGQLRELIANEPNSFEAYLRLGVLLRELDDPGRAAVLHRSLTVRPGLDRDKRVAVGMELADDLIALRRWEAAGAVLDDLAPAGGHLTRYLWLRFARFHGGGDAPEAARTLKRAARLGPERRRAEFARAYAIYQLDRALNHARLGEIPDAEARLKDVEKDPQAGPRIAFVRAQIAAHRGDATAAIAAVNEGLLEAPTELTRIWPTLEHVLLQSGQYERTIPILESVCTSAGAPPHLWIALALLYDKLGQRTRAVELIESKRGDPRLTPDAAAAYLRLLVADQPSRDLQRVWGALTMPSVKLRQQLWKCPACGRSEPFLRWFCTECRYFGDYVPQTVERTVPIEREHSRIGPVRF